MRNFIIYIRMFGLGLLFLLVSCGRVQEGTSSDGQIYLATLPAGAMVMFDDITGDQTPTTLFRVAPGEHLLVARKSGYHEIRRTINTRIGERIALEIKLEPITAMALIYSKPESADVEIDGADCGKTPLLITDFLLGKHRMKVSAKGYLPKILDVTVADQTPQKIDVELVPDSAKLVVGSSPHGAQVIIDGGAFGKTPLTIPVIATGKHKIEIRREGCVPYSEEFTVRAGDSRNIDVTLRLLPGRISIVSVPERARIYLNNRFKTEAPFSSTNMPAGKYIIRAELKGYEPQTLTNVVVSGEESVVEFIMVKNSGTILLTTEPPGVSVYLDGEKVGLTRVLGDGLISVQTQIDFVARGQRKLQFSKQGYYDLAKTITIKPNQEAIILHERLKRRPIPFVPTVIIRTGIGEEHMFKGIIRERYDNGDIKLEVNPGIFKLFKSSEIISMTLIPRE